MSAIKNLFSGKVITRVVAAAMVVVFQLSVLLDITVRGVPISRAFSVFGAVLVFDIALAAIYVATYIVWHGRGAGGPLMLVSLGVLVGLAAAVQAAVSVTSSSSETLLKGYGDCLIISSVAMVVMFFFADKVVLWLTKKWVFVTLWVLADLTILGPIVYNLICKRETKNFIEINGTEVAIYWPSTVLFILLIAVTLNSQSMVPKLTELFEKKSIPMGDPEMNILVSLTLFGIRAVLFLCMEEFTTLLLESIIYLAMLSLFNGIRNTAREIRRNAVKQKWFLIIVGGFSVVFIFMFVVSKSLRDHIDKVVVERFFTLFEEVNNSFHLGESKIAILRGGLFGVKNISQMRRVQYGTTDSVFAYACQLLGAVGGFVILGLFLVLTLCALRSALLGTPPTSAKTSLRRTNENIYFTLMRLDCAASAVCIIALVLICIASACGSFIFCGAPLPLFANGKSSAIINGLLIGIMLRREKDISVRPEYERYKADGNASVKRFLSEYKEGFVRFREKVAEFFRRESVRRTLHRAHGVLAAVAMLVGIVLVVALIVSVNILGKTGDVELSEEEAVPAKAVSDIELMTDKKVRNILVLGVDVEENSKSRSDAMMVVSINMREKTINQVSIARDTYVEVAGHGNTKITHAYAYGGADLAKKTIESNFRIKIDGVVVISVSAIPNVIERLGTIRLDLTAAEADYLNELCGGKLEEGEQTLKGNEAQLFAQIRKRDNDFARQNRQKELLVAIIKEILSRGPGAIGIINDLAPLVSTSYGEWELMEIATDALFCLIHETPEEKEAAKKEAAKKKEKVSDSDASGSDVSVPEAAKTAEDEGVGFNPFDAEMSLPIEQGAATRTIKGESVLQYYEPYNVRLLHEFLYGVSEE